MVSLPRDGPPLPKVWLLKGKAPALENRGLVSTGWEAGSAYRSNVRVNVKVLDFVKRGGPKLTVDRTIFEMRLGL